MLVEADLSEPVRRLPELLARYASSEQKARWLTPLLEGKIRSAFAMTEKGGT
jgi:alkylation response protein AidB-like acyl-CoA dehydrogenase